MTFWRILSFIVVVFGRSSAQIPSDLLVSAKDVKVTYLPAGSGVEWKAYSVTFDATLMNASDKPVGFASDLVVVYKAELLADSKEWITLAQYSGIGGADQRLPRCENVKPKPSIEFSKIGGVVVLKEKTSTIRFHFYTVCTQAGKVRNTHFVTDSIRIDN